MSTDLTPYRSRSLSRRERRVATIVQEEQLPARCAAARLQGAAAVAQLGAANIELLTQLEAQAAKRAGAAVDARLGAVVDTYSGLVVTELVRLSLGGDV